MSKHKIRGKCKCGRCTWEREVQHDGEIWYRWVMSAVYYSTLDDIGELNFCPVCGCRLTDNGFAYEVVGADRQEEHEAVLRRALIGACDGDELAARHQYLLALSEAHKEASDD